MDKVKETLEKQLELLSERSKQCATDRELISLTNSIVLVVSTIARYDSGIEIDGAAIASAFCKGKGSQDGSEWSHCSP